MLSPGHEIPVVLLAGEPWLLSALAGKLLGKALPGALTREDSTVRFGDAHELRPDLLFTVADCAGRLALEVQLRPDPEKARGWPVLVSILQCEHDTLGDLVILTSSGSVAKWARRACHAVGMLATRQRMLPTVLWVCDSKVNRLLDPRNPRLAFFAAWAMRTRYGPRAKEVVERALKITELLPEPLRSSQIRAIFGVLNPRLRSKLKEDPVAIDESKLPPLPDWWIEWERKCRARGIDPGEALYEAGLEARGVAKGMRKGKREALLAIFSARGLLPTPEEKVRLVRCMDGATLDRWIARAIDAPSVKDALDWKPPRRRKPPAAGVQASEAGVARID